MRAKGFEHDRDCAYCTSQGYTDGIRGCDTCAAQWRPIDRKGETREEGIESREETEENEERKEPSPTPLVVDAGAKQERDRRDKKKGKKGKKGKRAFVWSAM